MIEYYITMVIFALIILSILYFIYKWYLAVKEVNNIILNSSNGINDKGDTLLANAGLNQPCVLKTNNIKESIQDPICDESFGLTCVVGMYVGNGVGSNTGVCLSNIGSSCNSLYDCVPWAQGCINGVCENVTETINFPCTYDSDCIGEVTCIECKSGIGPCRNLVDGSCIELIDGECPPNYELCNSSTENLLGEFRFNHICDTSLQVPKCKYNISPKDQGCSTDSDCIQLGEGTICYTGTFKSNSNPDGILLSPSYSVKIENILDTAIITIDFGNSLLTTSSFEAGTLVTFVPKQQNNEVSTINYGPYFIRDQIDEDRITIMDQKLQPNVEEYVLFPNKYIELNENSYYRSPAIKYTDLNNILDINTNNYDIVFGIIPETQIKTECNYSSVTGKFTFVNISEDGVKLVNGQNVLIDRTEVRFSISIGGNPKPIEQGAKFILSSISDNGTSFNAKGDNIEDIEKNGNNLAVLFGNITNPILLNDNKGVCVSKLPPSASIVTDSKYDLTKYQGNPCINLFDNSMAVETSDGFCKFTNSISGAGSVCQFSREGDNPLPCDTSITKVFQGVEYNLSCLIDNDLTETVKNNPNFLNSSFSGVCSFPVHDKFKQCFEFDNNCNPPYICTEFEYGKFCDSRFDILQCNDVYSCPPGFECQDGYCKSTQGNFCVSENDCLAGPCRESLKLAFYNSTIDQYTDKNSKDFKINRIIDVPLPSISGKSALDYKLYAKSKYRPDNTLETYVFLYNYQNSSSPKSYLARIDNPLSENISASILQSSINTGKYDNYLFSDDNGEIILWGWKDDTSFTIESLYPSTVNKIFTENYGASEVLSVDIIENDLLVTLSSSVSGIKFKNLNNSNNFQEKNYSIARYRNFSKPGELYDIPYFSQTYDNLTECKYDLLNINDTGLDIVCTHISEDVGNPILGVRHNVSKYNSTDNRFDEVNSAAGNCGSVLLNNIDNEDRDIGCFLNPIISVLDLVDPQSYPLQYDSLYPITIESPATLYLVPNKNDINTLYSFSRMSNLRISDVKIVNMYKDEENLYIETETGIQASILENLILTFSPPSDFAPFSFTQTSNNDNYGNVQDAYLQYPYWITDLKDLIVGDNYNPTINKIFYEPNRENRNYYAIVNMFTEYQNNPILEKIIESDSNIIDGNTYMFRFSSDNNELSLTVDETIPIRISGPTDINRFAQCNQTGNMFFLANICSS